MPKDISSFIQVNILFCTHFQEKGDSHGTERNRKRLIFQTEGYGKSDVTYELRMCLPYIPDSAKRKTVAELVRKLDVMLEKDCLALNHRIEDLEKEVHN